MHLILLTAKIMLRRAACSRGVIWLCGFLCLCTLLVAPSHTIPGKFVSLLAMLPSVFLITGWYDSQSRIGLASLVFRSGGDKMISIAEIALPSLAGTALGILASLLVKAPPPWQFWVVISFFSTAFTLLFASVESHFRNPGRFILSVLWVYGVKTAVITDSITHFLSFTEYPFAVLTTNPEAGGFHPDAFVLSSLLLLAVSAAVYILPARIER